MKEHKENPEITNIRLRREIGLVSAVNFLISIIVGSGIFVTPGKVLAECGSVGMTMTIWTVCGIIAFLTCLPFGELSTVVPKSGSIYIYFHTAFNSYHPFFGGLPSFIYFWIVYIIIQPCNTALNAILFADYSFVILQSFMSPEFLARVSFVKCTLGALSLVGVSLINCISVKLYVKSQDFLTYTKMAAIIFTVGCGGYLFLSGKAYQYDVGFEGTKTSAHDLIQALYFALFAYDGGWGITGITEELKNPSKNVLYSIVIALLITTATYILLNLTFLTALTTDEMAGATTVIADFAKKMFGPSGGAMAAAIICLCLLTANMSGTFSASRMGYVAAREGHIVELLCYIHKTRCTPIPAVVAQLIISLIYFFLGGDVTFLIDISSFFMWMSYGVTMIALFVLRVKFPHAFRPFRVPSAIPVIVMTISFLLVGVSVWATPPELLIAFGASLVLIFALYYIFIYKAYRIKNLDMLQNKLQTLLKLVPPPDVISPGSTSTKIQSNSVTNE